MSHDMNDEADPQATRSEGLSRRAFVVAPLAAAVPAAYAPAAWSRANLPGDLQHSLSAEDRLDIQDLFARYAWAYDCSDVEAFVANFTPDAVIEGYGKEHRGHEAIRNWLQYLFEMREKEGDDWLHDAYHHRFHGNRSACTVYSYATHFNSNRAGKRHGVRGAGYFVSDCVKIRGAWYFSRHSINAWNRTVLPWKRG